LSSKKLPLDYEGHDLTNYNNFLLECLEKDYSGQGTQNHHIFSKKFMGGTDDKENLITLNYEDHFKAHMILAMCFPKGHINRGRNYASAKLIVGNVRGHLQKRYGSEFDETAKDFWEIAHREVCELNKGENHPQFGTKLSPEQCKQMSERMKGRYVGELNHFFGKSHSEETKDLIREKRKLQITTAETRQKMSESNSGKGNPFYGKHHTEESKERIRDNHATSRPCIINGELFRSIVEAARKLNITARIVGNRLNSPKWPDWNFKQP
jgi:stalled ribosome alternative rescue factor ArfA